MMPVGVWGAGAEGCSAARALHAGGEAVLVVDESERPRPAELVDEAAFVGGPGALEHLLECSSVIVSPGVPRIHPFRERLRDAGISTTSLTDRWMRRAADTTIGVTGTKGKSTTTTLIGLLLTAAGVDTQVGGNIGIPLADLRADAEATVAELSSYQCASLTVAPRIAVVTSLYEDHLTWHGSKQMYWRDKARIAGAGCAWLICDDETLSSLRSLEVELPTQVSSPSEHSRARLAELALPRALQLRQNQHNLELAILAADTWLGREVTEQEILDAAAHFQPLPHRLTHVSDDAGLAWIDDTLSTVPESVIAASEAFSGELTLIVGGQDRGVDYDVLTEHLLARTPPARLVTIPGNGTRIAAGYRRVHPELVRDAETLDDAVRIAAELAPAGSTVALSPGAPSYDHFTNFADKSAAFIAAIEARGTVA